MWDGVGTSIVSAQRVIVTLRDTVDVPSYPIVICTDSQSALMMLSNGADNQRSARGAAIWLQLLTLMYRGREIVLQGGPSHCGLPGNARADTLSKEASALPQQDVAVDVHTAN